jgi:ABC-2 type transport system ATP-binding protein
MGAWLNQSWDTEFAGRRISDLGLNLRQRAGSLSGGQRAQLALTLAVAKRPELLLLDEPVASLDPLARREFLRDLMETVAEQQVSVVLSSHLIADIERVCDYLIVLTGSRVRIAGETEELLASHHRLSGSRRDPRTLPASWDVIEESHVGRQSTLLVRTSEPVLDPAWTVRPVSLEDLVLAYMSQPGPASAPPSQVSAQACNDYIESLHLRQTVTYQPASRYWAFQLAETAIYLALALALAGLSFWWINRNRSTAPNIRRPRTRQPAPALQNSP